MKEGNEQQTPKVIVTLHPCCVHAIGPYGGGYRRGVDNNMFDELVSQAASALMYVGYGRRSVKFIGPDNVRDELRKQGFDAI